MVNAAFDTMMAALGTVAVLGLISSWRAQRQPRGCLGIMLTTAAILLACGMLLGKVLL